MVAEFLSVASKAIELIVLLTVAANLDAVASPGPGILFHVGFFHRYRGVRVGAHGVPRAGLEVESGQGLERLDVERRPSAQDVDSALVITDFVSVARRRSVHLLLFGRLVEALERSCKKYIL